MPQPAIHYCANTRCPYLNRQMRPYFSTDATRQVCPECSSALLASCPFCGYAPESAPLRFCPSCGRSLFEAHSGSQICAVCGRHVYRNIFPEETFIVCSDNCLSVYIKQYVRICDQCGKPFDIRRNPDLDAMNSNISEVTGCSIECCSQECLNMYLRSSGNNTRKPKSSASKDICRQENEEISFLCAQTKQGL